MDEYVGDPVRGYEFGDRPLYTMSALELLEERQSQLDETLADGGQDVVPSYALLQGEKEVLEEYVQELQPYSEVLEQAYDDPSDIPRPETVLGRIRDDMDLMARERESRLDDTTPFGVSRREALETVFQDQDYSRPVLTDTWIIMKEAERLGENI
ncbi:MAG: hypothetical protein ABEK10_02490 [Candidatus Nanosalina sp.]